MGWGFQIRHEAPDLTIDIEAILPEAGDRKRFSGAVSVAIGEGCRLDFAPGEGVGWSLELRRLAGGVEIAGELSGFIELECDRCLETFDLPLSLKVKEHALLLQGGGGGKADDYGDEYLVAGGKLDLLPVLRDAIIMALPLKRVCSGECRGFCPTCGADLNLGECGCPKSGIDARLRPLEEIKKRLEAEGSH